MQDIELYGKILGVRPPWKVESVETDMKKLEITIHVEYDSNVPVRCPICHEPSPVHDRNKRRWRHLDTCQMRTIIECDVPRTRCTEHGVKQQTVSWAEKNSHFTALFEAMAISWLKETNIKAVSKQLRVSWSQVALIQEKAVQRGLERRKEEPVKSLGIDETSFQKRHEYVTVLMDNEKDQVIDVLDNRRAEDLDAWLKQRPEAERAEFETITMDMWDPYIKAVRENVPSSDEKICFDPFHVMSQFGKALDKVRAEEHREFLRKNGESCLKYTRFEWLRNSNKTDNRSRAGFLSLARSNMRTSRAWAIKETAARLWAYNSKEWAKKAWKSLCGWISRCRLEPVIKIGRTIRRYLWGILNAIVMKANNAKLEGKNARIQKIKSMACGFRNRERFKNAILFHLGGLDMMPNLVNS